MQKPAKSSCLRRVAPVCAGTRTPVPSEPRAVSLRLRRVLNAVDAPESASWKSRSASAWREGMARSHLVFTGGPL